MALVDATLSTALQNIENQALQAAIDGHPWTIKQYCDAKAAAHDTQTKTATVTVAVTSVTGVTTGGGTSGPGTGTGTVS